MFGNRRLRYILVSELGQNMVGVLYGSLRIVNSLLRNGSLSYMVICVLDVLPGRFVAL